jgi:hypothetical protein
VSGARVTRRINFLIIINFLSALFQPILAKYLHYGSLYNITKYLSRVNFPFQTLGFHRPLPTGQNPD